MNDGPARHLFEKGKEVVKRKDYQFKLTGKFWCNQAFFTICEEMGYDIDCLCNYVHNLNRRHRCCTNANSIYINAKNAEKDGIIDSINKYKAIHLADEGTLVLVAAHSLNGIHGHIAIVSPDSPDKELKVIQAGYINGRFKMSKVFPSDKVTEPILYDLSNLKLKRWVSA